MLSSAGSVAYAEMGQDGVHRITAVKIIRFGAPLFFANVSLFKVPCCRCSRCAINSTCCSASVFGLPLQDCIASEIMKRKMLSPRLRWHGLLLDFSNISSVDSTALSVLSEIIEDFQKRSLRLCLANVSLGVSPAHCCWCSCVLRSCSHALMAHATCVSNGWSLLRCCSTTTFVSRGRSCLAFSFGFPVLPSSLLSMHFVRSCNARSLTHGDTPRAHR